MKIIVESDHGHFFEACKVTVDQGALDFGDLADIGQAIKLAAGNDAAYKARVQQTVERIMKTKCELAEPEMQAAVDGLYRDATAPRCPKCNCAISAILPGVTRKCGACLRVFTTEA